MKRGPALDQPTAVTLRGTLAGGYIEPLVAAELERQKADAATVARIATALAEHTRTDTGVGQGHNVRVRSPGSGLVVNYHCRVNPTMDVYPSMNWWTIWSGASA